MAFQLKKRGVVDAVKNSPFLFIALATLVFAGCSSGDRPPLGSVSGTITIDGLPAGGLIVMFTPSEGRPAAATTKPDGTYTLEYTYGVSGAKTGTAKVHFEWPLGASGPPIPAECGSNSELTFDVKSGSNTFDYDIKSGKTDEEAKPVD
ncbi:MAG: hypothetical protein KF777_19365 [Planctomycetaceae bacterium]|nr:hypothetical protein [Planctomycetaceae bacterium]